jgi:tRNA nucleotidyltransferase (CCA-adding enzyme)
VAAADQRGRAGRELDPFPEGEWLLARAAELHVRDGAPAPLIMGRHLIGLGLEPGPAFGPLLDACYDAQLEGQIASVEEGLAFVRRQLAGPAPARNNPDRP